MVEITFVEPDGSKRVVDAVAGLSLMEAARNEGVRGIEAECGGACSCSTCHVYIAADWIDRLPGMSALEEDMLDFAYEPDPSASRLACQITVTDDLHGLLVNMPQRQG
ncbi:2Fe-2S iron-sulfur cluster-binding protein [Paracoccus onubensis]|uniref:2Fe-2S ferredoxin n=1 Tax=Paracoccus onubensis TaxID=1675788 RepID=A0A418T7P4_9RHOB|nr:2Fe-2S iron-sulfur cluster-binding protein [Paracoccus onubensis]RJE89244.1 2Fe-2S ferredoxin [Paracoccus onubensis]